MKRLFFVLVVGLVVLVQGVFAGVIAKADTWQMMGYRVDVNLSKVAHPDVREFSIVWYWDDGNWKAFSKDPAVLEVINRLGLYGDTLKSNQGFYVKAKQDFKILPYTPEASLLPTAKGWHLISINGGSFYSYSDNLPANVGAVYMYRNGVWDYIRKLSDGTLQKSKNYLTNYENEGFWIYNTIDSTDNYPINWYYKEASNNTFSNKTFSFDGNSITLDQNGSVISNISAINGGKWKGFFYNDWGISFGVKKGDKKYYYNATMAYDSAYRYPLGYYNLSYIGANIFRVLPSGIEEILDVNRTDFYDQNITVNITDYNPPKVLDEDIKSALDTLKNIADIGDDDARVKLNNIKTSLSNSTSKDAKVVLALINFIEILDTDIVKNSFLVNSENLDINSFASTVIPDESSTIKLVKNLSDYEGNAKALMQDLSNRLKTNADNLKALGLDENYYFRYDKIKLNFVDIKELRMAMLALSFKLQFIASYEFGNDEWLSPTTEDIDSASVEYIKAASDPVAFLNSGIFFVKPDQTKLTRAKSILTEFLELYYEFLDSENYAKEGMNIPERDLDARNLKRDIKLALDNLNGKTDSMDIVDDYIDFGVYDSQTGSQDISHKYEKGVFDLNSLFDASKAITIKDFGIFSYSGVHGEYDSKMSKRYNSPTSLSGADLSDDITTEIDFSIPNHINNFFKSYTDGKGVVFTGSNLLNEIFNTN